MSDERLSFIGLTGEEAGQTARDPALARELEAVAALLPGFIYQIRLDDNGDWTYTFVGGRVEEMFGVTAAEVLADAESLLGCIHPGDRDRVLAESRACAEALEPWRGEFRMIHRDGRTLWIEANDLPRRLDDGSVLCTGYANDITDRKQAERRAHVQSTALEAAANAIVITDRDGIIQWANAAFTRASGFSLEEARNRRPGELVGSGEQDEAFYENLWNTILGGEVWQGEIVNRRRGGELRTEEMTITPVTDEHGEITHFIAIKQDITDRLELEEQLRRAQRLESIGQLTGGVAHDFNNLLTVILGNAEVLIEHLSEKPELKKVAEMVVQGARRGADLTRRLLAFARKQPLDPKSVNVNQLVEGMEPMLRRSLGEAVEIDFLPAADLSPALVDPGQLEDALLNLAINARDAMPAGGSLTIETRDVELDRDYAERHVEVEPGRYVLVAISDTGCGIPEENFQRLFEPFFTTKERGTGLGLPMVYGFIKQSRGHVNVYSEVGEGTTVRLYLPRARSPAEPRVREAAEAAAGETGATILLVEDDGLVRAFAEDQLAGLGYRVLSAASGPDALAVLHEHEDIDLLFTDIVMPGGMNGRELADAAREIRPELKVLYTSGYTGEAIVHHGRLDPGAELLNKPYRRGELAERIRRLLES